MTQADSTDFNGLARVCLSNSARWFPELHRTDKGAAMHFLVGFLGEWGEYVDARAGERAEELADLSIYWLDLCGILDVDLIKPPPQMVGWMTVDMLRDIAWIANKVKKWNRGGPKPEGGELANRANEVLARLWSEWRAIHANPAVEIARKTAICESRWG